MPSRRLLARVSCLAVSFALTVAAACGLARLGLPSGQAAAGFSLTSPDMPAGQRMPQAFTCDGSNTSPALRWGEPPPGTKALALLMVDPDAPGGTFVHWLAYNLPPLVRELKRGASLRSMPPGSREGRNGFGRLGYAGPCPPPGQVHRYVFRLYALDAPLQLPDPADLSAFASASSGHIVAEARLEVVYGR